MEIDARIMDDRTNQQGTFHYVQFNNLDTGQFSDRIPTDQWNGFKVGDDVRLVGRMKSRSLAQPLPEGRTMDVDVLAFEIESIHAKKAS